METNNKPPLESYGYNPNKIYKFDMLPRPVRRMKKISMGAKITYGMFCGLCGKDGFIRVKITNIAEGLGVTERQAAKYVKELKRAKLLACTKTGRANSYNFLPIENVCNTTERDMYSKEYMNDNSGIKEQLSTKGYNNTEHLNDNSCNIIHESSFMNDNSGIIVHSCSEPSFIPARNDSTCFINRENLLREFFKENDVRRHYSEQETEASNEDSFSSSSFFKSFSVQAQDLISKVHHNFREQVSSDMTLLKAIEQLTSTSEGIAAADGIIRNANVKAVAGEFQNGSYIKYVMSAAKTQIGRLCVKRDMDSGAISGPPRDDDAVVSTEALPGNNMASEMADVVSSLADKMSFGDDAGSRPKQQPDTQPASQQERVYGVSDDDNPEVLAERRRRAKEKMDREFREREEQAEKTRADLQKTNELYAALPTDEMQRVWDAFAIEQDVFCRRHRSFKLPLEERCAASVRFNGYLQESIFAEHFL